jgi:hypothetical protein
MKAVDAHALPLEFARRCIITKMNKDKRSTREDARERVQLGLVALALINAIETIDEVKAAEAFGLWSPPTNGATFNRKMCRQYLRDVADFSLPHNASEITTAKQKGTA